MSFSQWPRGPLPLGDRVANGAQGDNRGVDNMYYLQLELSIVPELSLVITQKTGDFKHFLPLLSLFIPFGSSTRVFKLGIFLPFLT